LPSWIDTQPLVAHDIGAYDGRLYVGQLGRTLVVPDFSDPRHPLERFEIYRAEGENEVFFLDATCRHLLSLDIRERAKAQRVVSTKTSFSPSAL
jgi:hypothetical protein